MKILLLSLFAVIVLTTVSSAKAPETLKLRVGQSKTVDRGRVTLKFVSIVEDSRCPMNARCVWAGNAKIKIAVTHGRAAAKIIELNSGLDPQSVTVSGYEIGYGDLTPWPGAGVSMSKRPKTATIFIKRIR